MRIDIWSDVVCPWCYLGKRHLEQALAEFPDRAEIELHWHSYELDPVAPARDDRPMTELIAKKYGMSLEDAAAGQERLTALAAGVGLDYHLDATKRANTFDAHRLLHLAAANGCQDELKEALLDAYFSKGQAVGDHAVLRELAASVGLEASDVDGVLGSERYSDHVRHDEQAAAQLEVTGVPFFVFDGKYGVAGAQPANVLLEVMSRAWDERDVSDRSPAEGAGIPAE